MTGKMKTDEKSGFQISFVSDSALRVFLGPDSTAVLALFKSLSTLIESGALLGIENLHPAYESLTIDFDPQAVLPAELEKQIANVCRRIKRPASSSRLIEIPVVYDDENGPDLADASASIGLTREQLIARHTSSEYEVAFLGFSPGFPYLRGLDPALSCARKQVPRLKVPAGSVAIGGNQTGIYPEESPGGWQLIGRTGLELFDPSRDPATLLAPGDRVRFTRTSELPRARGRHLVARPAVNDAPEVLEVTSGGFHSTIQDLGRFRYSHLGISRAGAADALALRLGNRLVGNRDGAAAIEMTVSGGSFRFLKSAWIAFSGSDCGPSIDGEPITMATSFPVRAGQTVRTGSLEHGARSYLCVNGGVNVPVILGSRATFVSGKWGGLAGRALQAGDRLSTASDALRPPGYRRLTSELKAAYRAPVSELRATRGPQWEWFSSRARQDFFSCEFEVTMDGDRRGLRLAGPPLEYESEKRETELVTEGVANGAVQVPAGGQALALFCEQQTTGGYPKIANVIRADLFRLGQLRPGNRFKFRECSFEEAWRLSSELERVIERSIHVF